MNFPKGFDVTGMTILSINLKILLCLGTTSDFSLKVRNGVHEAVGEDTTEKDEEILAVG